VGGNGFGIFVPLKFEIKDGFGELFFIFGVIISILFLCLITSV
jgi:hypothetical protein